MHTSAYGRRLVFLLTRPAVSSKSSFGCGLECATPRKFGLVEMLCAKSVLLVRIKRDSQLQFRTDIEQCPPHGTAQVYQARPDQPHPMTNSRSMAMSMFVCMYA